MCGIFGGYKINQEEVKKAINLIKRGEDGINIEELHKNIIFASRRHLVKNLKR